MPVQIIDCQQGTDRWRQVRMGLVTASGLTAVKAKGRDGSESETRKKYMLRLANEIISGRIDEERFSNADTDRGVALEPEAREMYAMLEGVEVTQIGFARNGNVGASPDGLVGSRGGIEIKCARPEIHIARKAKGKLPPEYKAQVHGNMMVLERDWWDFVGFCAPDPDNPSDPARMPLILRIERDDLYIRELREECDRFNEELVKLVESLGGTMPDTWAMAA